MSCKMKKKNNFFFRFLDIEHNAPGEERAERKNSFNGSVVVVVEKQKDLVWGQRTEKVGVTRCCCCCITKSFCYDLFAPDQPRVRPPIPTTSSIVHILLHALPKVWKKSFPPHMMLGIAPRVPEQSSPLSSKFSFTRNAP